MLENKASRRKNRPDAIILRQFKGFYRLIPKHTSGSPIKALKLSPKDVRNLNKATSVEGYGDKVITDEYGNFIPASEIYKYGIVNSSGNMEGFIPEILVSPKYSITKEHLLSRTRVTSNISTK